MRQLLDLLLVAVEGVAGRFGDGHGAPLDLPQETQTELLFDLVGKFLPCKKCLSITRKLCQQLLFCLLPSHHQIPHRIAQQLARGKEPLVQKRQKFPLRAQKESKRPDVGIVFHKAVPQETFPADSRRQALSASLAVVQPNEVHTLVDFVQLAGNGGLIDDDHSLAISLCV